MNFQELVKQLIWIPDSLKQFSGCGGVVHSVQQKMDQIRNLTDPWQVLWITNGIPSSDNKTLPFPSYEVRNKSQSSLPKNGPAMLEAEQLIDGPSMAFKALAYTFKSAVPLQLDSALTTTQQIKHVLIDGNIPIFWTSSNPQLRNLLKTIRFKKKEKQMLKQRAITSIKARYNHRQKKSTPRLSEHMKFEQWKWYSFGLSIKTYQNNDLLPIRDLKDISIAVLTAHHKKYSNFITMMARYHGLQVYPIRDQLDDRMVNVINSYDYVIIPFDTTDKKVPKVLPHANTHYILVNFTGTPLSDSSKITEIIAVNNSSIMQDQTAQLIFGAIGRRNSPVYGGSLSLSNPLDRLRYASPLVAGLDPEVLVKVDTLIWQSIREKAIPGCQVVVVHKGIVAMNKSYGYLTYDSLEPVKESTLYDLASLTKPLATIQAMMYLTEHGAISLDEPLSNYLPWLNNTNKKEILIREVLSHQSGIQSFYPYWSRIMADRTLRSRLISQTIKKGYLQEGKQLFVNPTTADSLSHWIGQSKLIKKEVKTHPFEYAYSDLGFILIKSIIDNITHKPFDDFMNETLYGPIGTNLLFNPLCKTDKEQIAPTEYVHGLRSELLWGYVHDSNAALSGGVAGHAGLFGNANAVAKVLELQLQGGTYGGHYYFKPSTIKTFTKRQYINNRRGLGWDKPGDEMNGPVSELASSDTFGHTGFTGTAAWADPVNQLIFVFLSNRVYPNSDNLKLIEENIRTRIQTLLYGAIITK